MKVLFAVLILAFVSSSQLQPILRIGDQCESLNLFKVTNFTVSPYPPVASNPQAVVLNGTFSDLVCPTQIFIHELYQRRETYDQIIDLSRKCYKPGDNNTYNFLINPKYTGPGNYLIQVLLQDTASGQRNLACWEYIYRL
jgi:hypothetical protein